ncbi:ADP-ribosylglycohydrolase family protein [Nocardia mangyaensis]|uniref:ADP-ribosylglycohydrolase family protein n=1 Tax=Nocardia mangyaensis TaxID=2213200 RepID=UPI0026755262|nr:ADP-ribosylglycohydrolase family protein [Nocardia mangyaensis]MDO3645883.1 ADP-ribosylglycohydrolase family protein [Nocardia mangyaensis]
MLDSLDGLSVGDALGAQFFIMGRSLPGLRAGNPPPGPWDWTDDTEMACSVVAELRRHQSIDPDRLARGFARRFSPERDYGHATVTTLRRIREGKNWRETAATAFDGHGSCGNGAAMRVAPLGAFYVDDPQRAVTEAIRTARITHAHPEGVIGAVAVALAARQAAHARRTRNPPTPTEFLTAVADPLEPGRTTFGVRRARDLLGATLAEAVHELGNGSRVTAQDTVPFALWAAATHFDDYPAAIAACIEADGDIDTTSAIVGGIVAAHTGTASRTGVPEAWLTAREPLPPWLS